LIQQLKLTQSKKMSVKMSAAGKIHWKISRDSSV